MNSTDATLVVRSSICHPHLQAVRWAAVQTASGPDRGLRKVVPVGVMEIGDTDHPTEDHLVLIDQGAIMTADRRVTITDKRHQESEDPIGAAMVQPPRNLPLRTRLDMVQVATVVTAIALHLEIRTFPATETKVLDLESPMKDSATGDVDPETRHTRETVRPMIARTVGEDFETEPETRETLDTTDGMAEHDHEAPTGEIGGASGTVMCTGGRITCTISVHRTCVIKRCLEGNSGCFDVCLEFITTIFLFSLLLGNDSAHRGLVRLTLVLYNMHGVGGSPRQGDAEGRLGSHEHLHGVSLLRCLHIGCRQ